MFLDQNEVSLFQKSPWNALCKNGILLKMPLFSKPNFKAIFQINTTTPSLYIQKPLNVAEIIRLRYQKIPKILQSSIKKTSFSRKLKITKFGP